MRTKKTISLTLCALLICLSVFALDFSSTALNTATVYSSFASSVNAGDTVQIPVCISDNPGIMGFMLSFDYDADVLTPVSVTYGDVLQSGLQDNIEGDAVPGSFKVYWSGNENFTANGIMLYVNAEISASAVGNTAITVGYSQADTFDEDFLDVALNCNPIEFSVTNSSYSGYAKITSAAQNVTAGEDFNLTLTLSELNGLSSMSVEVAYDASAFSFNSASGSAAVSAVDSGSAVTLSLSSLNASMNGTVIVTLSFGCDANAMSGNYTFAVASSTEGVICKSCSNTVSASATSEIAVITAENGAGFTGQSVEIPVSIANNHGVMGYRLRFTYDSSLLEPVSITDSGLTSGSLNDSIGVTDGCFDVLWSDSSEFYDEGVLFTITFNVIGGGSSLSSVGVSYVQQDTFNESYEDVVFDCNDFTLTVNPPKGDVNLNGTVEPDDYSLFVEYLSGEVEFSEVQLSVGDMDDDTACDAFDLFYINKAANGIN